MIGFKLVKFPYLTFDGNKKEVETFFFGHPCENPNEVYSYPIRESFTVAEFLEANKVNIDLIIEYTNLQSLKNLDIQMQENVPGSKNKGHILNRKINFVDRVVEQIAIFYLVSINQLLWEDTKYDEFLQAPIQQKTMNSLTSSGSNYRWQRTGVSLHSAINWAQASTEAMSSFYETYIKSRFNPKIIEQRLAIDLSNMVNEIKMKTGGKK
jgi:hypothetical protein